MTLSDVEPRVLKARLLADLVQAVTEGHLLQASAVAVLVGRSPDGVVLQALRGQERNDAEADQRLQLHLRNVVTVLSVAARHFRDVQLAVQWYRAEILAAHDGQQTPEELTVAGQLEDAYRLLLRAPREPRGRTG